MEFRALVWNLFHGRDHPPDPALRSWRSRLLRFDERNATHVQVNRDLTREFATLLASAQWTWRYCRSARHASPNRWRRPAGRNGTGR
jgi:hypothetical protein